MANLLKDDTNKYQKAWDDRGPNLSSKEGLASNKYGSNMQTSLADQEARAGQAGSSAQESDEAPDEDEGGLYKKGVEAIKARGKFWTRRKKVAGGLLGGGVVGVFISISLLAPLYKVPSIMGGIDALLPGRFTARAMAEKPFKRMVIKYMVAKKAGTLAQVARPGSALSKLYGVFDAINVEKIIGERTGAQVVKVNGVLHVYHNGKSVGTLDPDGDVFKQWQALEKNNKALAKAGRDITRKALPVFELGTLSARLRLFMYAMGFSKGFTPIQDTDEDKDKTPEQREQDLNKRLIENVSDSPGDMAGEVLECLLGGNQEACDASKRAKQAVEVSDPTARGDTFNPVDLDDSKSSGQRVENELKPALDEAKVAVPDASGTILKTVTNKLIGSASGKIVVAAVPVLGWIDVLAQLQHIADQLKETNIVNNSMKMLRERQAGSAYAEWSGFADNIKDGVIPLSVMSTMGNRLTGYEEGDMVRALQGREGSGVPVEAKIDNGGQDGALALSFFFGISTEDVSDFGNCQTPEDFKGINIGQCVMHGFLYLWYITVSKALEVGADFAAKIILFTTPQYWLAKWMPEYFGNQWQEVIVSKAVSAILRVTGFFGFDPTASGGSLGNTIAIGGEVTYQRYNEVNLGGRDVTGDPSVAAVYLEAENEQREYMASLPLGERLFSFSTTGSLANKLAAAMPSKFDPGSIAASIIQPLKSLPSNLMSLVSGRGWAAAVTAQKVFEVGGVRQFGGNLQELEADIPPEISDIPVEQIKDLQCPENADGFFNNCQRYKEVIQGAMCLNIKEPCPELQ